MLSRMLPIEHLRSRLLKRKFSPATGSVKESSISNSVAELDPQQRCSAGGHFMWNEARRTHSDPTPLRAASDAAEAAGRDTDTLREEVTEEDDDVFYDTDYGFPFVNECYSEVATLQRVNKWVWSTTLREDVYAAWEEWRVPHTELQLERVPLTTTSREVIYSGLWHGRVAVRTREARDVSDLSCFLQEVLTLSYMRHQNIQLFMGAAIQPGATHPLILIMSEVRGHSLHTRLYLFGHAFTYHSKLQILNQIAEGMAYLHAKTIPHGLLTSTHISLTCRVCISLAPRQPKPQIYYPPELSYLPPEYIRTLHITTPSLPVTMRAPSVRLWREGGRKDMFQADVFAFGTLAYELETLKLPFHCVAMETLILRVGRGECQSLQLLKRRHLATIIESCWKHTPHHRPSFANLVKDLEQNVVMTIPPSITRSRSMPTLLTS